MKKTLSLLLAVIMTFFLITPAFAAPVGYEAVPIVYIRGNGEVIFDAEGNEIAVDLEGILSSEGEEEGDGTNKIVEAVANILLPFLTEGLIMDKWDNYGRAVYEELAPLFEGSALDANGEASNKTGVSQAAMDASMNALNFNHGADGWFDLYDYSFCYDWRLSPYDHVDRLHQYIQSVMSVTKSKKVCIFARCFGGSLLSAYLEKYGSLGHVKNAMFCDVLSNGTTIISKAFSGKISFDSNVVQMYLGQLDQCGRLGAGQGFVLTELLNEIVLTTVDLFKQVGVLDSFTGGIEELYEKLYKALIPAVCFASGIATQANYWTCVSEEDFDEALELIFGEEDSEAYTYYEGLINKITYYRDHVTSRLPELYKTFSDDYGIHIGVIGKYGYITAPFVDNAREAGDALVSLKSSSLGATVADAGRVLSEDYISSRISDDFGKYISPDKMVDVSTAVFPDTTWIFKNAHHDYFSMLEPLIADFLRSTNMTISSPGATAQFNVCTEMENGIGTFCPMTEDNSAEYDWISVPVEEPDTESRLVSFMRWLTMLFNVLFKVITGQLSFDSLTELFS